MTVSELIVLFLDNGIPDAEVLITDSNGINWALQPDDIKIEKEGLGGTVTIDSPNVHRPT
jgi:hypothetical protein